MVSNGYIVIRKRSCAPRCRHRRKLDPGRTASSLHRLTELATAYAATFTRSSDIVGPVESASWWKALTEGEFVAPLGPDQGELPRDVGGCRDDVANHFVGLDAFLPI
jgi:hypothetical protein